MQVWGCVGDPRAVSLALRLWAFSVAARLLDMQ
jgi:hypothetical protein